MSQLKVIPSMNVFTNQVVHHLCLLSLWHIGKAALGLKVIQKTHGLSAENWGWREIPLDKYNAWKLNPLLKIHSYLEPYVDI